jgi:serine/threonine protein kinase
MPSPATNEEFLELVRKSGVLDEKRLNAYLDKPRAPGQLPGAPAALADQLVRDGLLTHFQAEQIMQGKWRRFTIGKYKVLERLGSGGMGSVYLCEHKFMRRRAAVKVLPAAKSNDPAALERFYREARAVAALDHPNIVRAYDIDQEENLHYLVMEFVDGASLQEIVKQTGSMDPIRAAHYIRQAALGLQHAHEAAGIVHRDIKPGNILVDRGGLVKVLDMGLARFFHDEDDLLTKKYDENVLGTADYLAPEQALDSHSVDIRADIYSLGATFYFCLTGRTPFSEGTVAQKLIWHQTRQPKPIRTLRSDLPDALLAVIEKMMAKDPANRYQTPGAVAEALSPWTQTPIPPPPEAEMPRLSPAALGGATLAPDATSLATAAASAAPPSSRTRKVWQVPPGATPQPAPSPPSTSRGQESGRGPRVQAETSSILPSTLPQAPRDAGKANITGTKRPLHPPAPANNGAARAAGVAKRAPEDDSLPWDQATPDTDDPTARADTTPREAPRPVPRPVRSSKPESRKLKTVSSPEAGRNWLWWLVVAVWVAFLVGLGIVFGILLFGRAL